MDKTQTYKKLTQLHLKFFKFACYWDLHKDGNLHSPDSEYGTLRKELIDLLLTLDKDDDSKTSKALNR